MRVRWWRLALVAFAAVVAAVTGTVLAVAVNVATGGTAGWFPAVGRHPLRWTAGATVAVAAAGLLVWQAQRWNERKLAVLVPAVQRPEPWVVDRPGEVGQIVAALRTGRTVGVTTAVHGAGGFGKTTVAKLVRADHRVLRRYRGRVYWVTLGRDVGKQALAGVVNGLIAQVDPGRPVTFTDARQAGDHLAAVLAAGPRRLLVLDDVWSEEQLAVFPAAGRCARLVTTRIPSLAAGTRVPVKVDQMSGRQARALLLAGLPPLPGAAVQGLVEETGRWPLLLRLVNKILTDQARLHPDITPRAEELLARLRAGGALQVDQLTGIAGQQLDVGDPGQRNKAVLATIQASTSLLLPAEFDRFAELAVFAEDETIPLSLITALWQATGGLDRMAAEALCTRLADLALLTLVPGGEAVTMHDVIRDFLREELTDARITQLHGLLLETVADGLPSATAAVPGGGVVTAWWELPEAARYLWEHLIEHLLAAGCAGEVEDLATDLRWAGARLQASGPAGPYADLALIGTPRAERLRRMLGQAAHLLAPTDPPHSLIDILYSRVSHDPDWGAQAQALAANRKLPALISKWPLPDLPSAALRRVLSDHVGGVTAVAIAPAGTWLATASNLEGAVRIWDAATGEQRATLTGHTKRVTTMAIAPDGTWLATASRDRTVRI
jgi:NB-ARC domain/WD domain, G-beta repeat